LGEVRRMAAEEVKHQRNRPIFTSRGSQLGIDRGTMHATDPFDKTHVQAILSKIQSGTDLAGDKKADAFALSMSKVFFVER
jgi:hypothetical protein